MKKVFSKIIYKSLILLTVLLSACAGDTVYNESQRVANPEWNKDSVPEFAVELPQGLYRVDVMLRNTDEYRYQNLWLFLTSQTADSTIVDTLQCFLADDYGRWVGMGLGSIYTNRFTWIDSVAVVDSLKVNYKIAHGMRHDELAGIKEVGIIVSEIE